MLRSEEEEEKRVDLEEQTQIALETSPPLEVSLLLIFFGPFCSEDSHTARVTSAWP